MGNGVVKYTGYKTGGVVKAKGLRNNRSAARRKEAENERKRLKQFESNDRKEKYSNPYSDYNER